MNYMNYMNGTSFTQLMQALIQYICSTGEMGASRGNVACRKRWDGRSPGVFGMGPVLTLCRESSHANHTHGMGQGL
jgi:hypothetical protein